MAIVTKPDSASKPLSAEQDLEHRILSSPEVQSLLSKLASKKLELGRNPVKAALAEQLEHARYHVLKFSANRDREHPELKYETPQAVVEASNKYLSKITSYAMCHLKSFLFGRDDLTISPVKDSGTANEDSNVLYRVENPATGESELVGHPDFQYPTFRSLLKAYAGYIPGELKRFGRHLLRVRNTVGYDAKRMAWESKAREFARSVSSTREPEFMRRSDEQAARFVKNSFSRMIVAGLEDILYDGKTVAEYLHEGGVIVFRKHPSYAGVAVDKDLYAKHGIDNMTFIAGTNIVNLKDKRKAAEWRMQLKRSGVKMVERNPPKGKDGVLYFAELGASIKIDLSEGGNNTIYGNGREKVGKESSLKTALISFFLEYGLFILPVAESYEVIPDDYELAHAAGRKTAKGGGASFDHLISLERFPEKGEEPYGEVYLNFGKPIPNINYLLDKKSMRHCEEDLMKLASQLTPLSSTYLLSVAVKNKGLNEFNLGHVSEVVGNLIEKVHYRNQQYAEAGVDTRVFTAPKLREGNLSDVVRDAAEKLSSRGALVKKDGTYFVDDAAILNFYAAKGEAPLRAHGILAAEAPVKK